MGRVEVAIALGSNLGDREAHLRFAHTRLAGILSGFRLSAVHETVPLGVSEPQPNYLNQAAVGETFRTPRELLALLLAIEGERGRARPSAAAARTLDLDLILAGDRVVSEPGLLVPHPRFRERLFVLEPLAEIAPAMIDPITGKTVRELLDLLTERLSAAGSALRRERP
jgi:2-amino-4-hydroxy-6-hydroxymethyldihydropteridine diphosphokinase